MVNLPDAISPFSVKIFSAKHGSGAKENGRTAPRCQPLLERNTPGLKINRFAAEKHGQPLDLKPKGSSRAALMLHSVNSNAAIQRHSSPSTSAFYGPSPQSRGGVFLRKKETEEKLQSLAGITVTVSAVTPRKLDQSHKPSRSRSCSEEDGAEAGGPRSKRVRAEEETPKARPQHLIGFRNQGATCYLNSVLQALSGLEQFCAEVLHELPMMSRQLCPLQSLLRARSEGRQHLVFPCLRQIHASFAQQVDPHFKSLLDQQDLDEFLTLYLDKIHSQIADKRRELQLAEPVRPTLVESNFSFTDTETRICKKCQNQVVCEQTYNVLHVSLCQEEVSHGQRQTVQQLVEATLQGPWNDCSNCNEFNSIKSLKKFTSLPRTLLMVMMRYNNQGQKLETPVLISPYINLDNFVSDQCQRPTLCSLMGSSVQAKEFESVASQTEPDILEIENPVTPETDNEDSELKEAMSASMREKWSHENEEEELKKALEQSIAQMDPFSHKPNCEIVYKLRAVVNHYGDSPNSGHYKCDVFRKEQSKWFNYNDLHVQERSSEDVLLGAEQVCYLLVYQFDGQYESFKSEQNQQVQDTTADEFDGDYFESTSSFFNTEIP